MASAVALGHNGLRLRSRRTRSGRSHRLPLSLVVIVIAIASAVGFVGAKIGIPLAHAAPAVDAATLEQQRFASELRPIRTQLQQSVTSLGLAVTAFESGDIDRNELQRRLAGVLKSYQDMAMQVDVLDAPPGEQPVVAEYVATLNGLTQSATALSKAYDDSDRARVAQALASSLAAVAQLHDLSPAPA